MGEEKKDRIDKLNDTLYSRTRYKDPLDKRTPVKEFAPPDVVDKWQTPELGEMLTHERIPPRVHPVMKKIFVSALLFFLAAIVVAGFVFTGGSNFVSSKNVDINVLGPTIVSAGKVLELGVSVTNTNNADLEFANLSIQYPQGSRNPDNNAEPLTYTKEDLGVVEAGAEAVHNIRAILLGVTGEVKEVKFSVEYKVKGSNATFYKDKIFEVTIVDAPITLSIDSPTMVMSGESFTTAVSVTLNSTEILKNVVLKAEYPYGYSVSSAVPEALADNNIWVLGDLSPGSKKTVTIRGQIVGENEEERTFRFYVGVSDSNTVNPNAKVILTSLLHTVAIDRPSIGLNILFNGENVPIYIAPAARSVSTFIKFKNNLPDKLLNPRLEVSFTGEALAPPSITGVPVSAVGQTPVTVSDSRIVRISSQVNFSSKALRTLGPFANYGPIPPKVGQETTYAIVWNVGNTRGDLVGTTVTARLGQGVSWVGAQSFGSENIFFDAPSNTVTWDLGILSSGTGFSSTPREVSFQIALTPTIGQVGTVPILVSSITLSGNDNVLGEAVTASVPSLTTRLTSDPAFIQGDDVVVK